MNKPVIFFSGNTIVRAGDIVSVRGEYLDYITGAVITDGKNEYKLRLIQHNRQSLKFTIPEGYTDGVYTVALTGDYGTVKITLNKPVIRWVQGNEGEFATVGGWLRVNGECLSLSETSSPTLTLYVGSTPITFLPDKIYDSYSVKFVPTGVKCGEYTAVYSNGYAESVEFTVKVGVAAEDGWGRKIYDVVELGFPTDTITDITDMLQTLLSEVGELGGGVIYFPRGRYHMKGTLKIPRGITIRGEGMTKTQLFWTDSWYEIKDDGEVTYWSPTRLPDTMIEADGDFAIEDIDFTANRIGGFLAAGSPDAPADNVRLDRVRIHANALAGGHMHIRCGRHLYEARCAVIYEYMMCRTDMLSLCGSNIKIRNCDFMFSGRPFAPSGGMKNLLLEDTVFHGATAIDDWMPLGQLTDSIIEDCEIHEWTSGCSGKNIYLARITIRDVVDNNREAFTTDIAYGTKYVGTVSGGGISYTFPDGVDLSRVDEGSTLCILSGLGAGQLREIVSVNGQSVTLDSEFDVPPDETSLCVANHTFRNWYFVDNTIINSGSLQLYTAQCNTVVDGTKFVHSASIKAWGHYVYGTTANNWYSTFVNNDYSDCNYYHMNGWYMDPALPANSFMCAFGEGEVTSNICCTMKNNMLGDGAMAYILGGDCQNSISDAVITGNVFSDARCAVYVDGHAERLLIKNNKYENCAKKAIFTDSETETACT